MVTGALIDQLEITGGDDGSDLGRRKDNGRNTRAVEDDHIVEDGGGSDNSRNHRAIRSCDDVDCNTMDENRGSGSDRAESATAGKAGSATATIHVFKTAPAPAEPAVVAAAGTGAAGALMETVGVAPAAAGGGGGGAITRRVLYTRLYKTATLVLVYDINMNYYTMIYSRYLVRNDATSTRFAGGKEMLCCIICSFVPSAK